MVHIRSAHGTHHRSYLLLLSLYPRTWSNCDIVGADDSPDDLDAYLPLTKSFIGHSICVYSNEAFHIIGSDAVQAAETLGLGTKQEFLPGNPDAHLYIATVKLSPAEFTEAVEKLCRTDRTLALFARPKYGSYPHMLEPDRIYSAGTLGDALSGHLMALNIEMVDGTNTLCTFAYIEIDGCVGIGRLALKEQLRRLLKQLRPKELLVNDITKLRDSGVDPDDLVVRERSFQCAEIVVASVVTKLGLSQRESHAAQAVIDVLKLFLSEVRHRPS
jgi:hypothetical protein